MFDKVSLNEACQKVKEYKKKMEKFKAQGAAYKGDRELDKQYTDLVEEAARYVLQFSEDESFAILCKCSREAELEEQGG
jgi:cell division protein FtsB